MNTKKAYRLAAHGVYVAGILVVVYLVWEYIFPAMRFSGTASLAPAEQRQVEAIFPALVGLGVVMTVCVVAVVAYLLKDDYETAQTDV